MMSFAEYQELIADRPEKAEPDAVNYRDAEGKERCSRCIHFFQSKDRAVCEIMRPEDEEDVEPNYVCNFYTFDGEEFPLQDITEHPADEEPETEEEPSVTLD